MLLDEMTEENIPKATTPSLMRARARDFCSQYTRLIRVKNPGDSASFAWRFPEGIGSESTRINILSKSITEKIQEIERLKADITANKDWKRRYKSAFRSSVALTKHMRRILQAIVTQLANRNRLVEEARWYTRQGAR